MKSKMNMPEYHSMDPHRSSMYPKQDASHEINIEKRLPRSPGQQDHP